MRDIDELIRAAFADEALSEDDVAQIAEHVASAGFDPEKRFSAGERLAGVMWQERQLRPTDLVTSAVAHYLSHVIVIREWPKGTAIEDYERSIAEIVRDESSGIFTCLYRGGLQIGAVRASGEYRGIEGHEWILIEYRVKSGYWVTAFQPDLGLIHLNHPIRRNLRWLRRIR